jgi:hypothetical protein
VGKGKEKGTERKGRIMPGWDVGTRSLSRKVLEQVVYLGTPETNWWTYRDIVGKELKATPDKLYEAVQLLIEEGDVESNTLDLYTVRATLRGWMKFPGTWGNQGSPERHFVQ